MRKLRLLLALCGALAIGLAVACGGDQDPGTPGAVAAPLDLASTADNLASLRSFRFDVAIKLDITAPKSSGSSDDAFGDAFAGALLGLLGDIKAEGALVAPNSVEMKMSMAGQEFAFVQIDNDAWVKYGSTWEKTVASASGFDFSSPSDLITDFLPQEALAGAKTSQETVNGVKTTRYSFDKKALEKLAQDMGETTAGLDELTSAKLDVWLTADNIPVKIVMDFAGKDESGQQMAMKMEMNVKDINSDSIKIKPPI
jgi:hypothetical protein